MIRSAFDAADGAMQISKIARKGACSAKMEADAVNLKSELIGPMVLNMVARSCDNPDVFLANHYLLVRSQFSPEITHLHYLGTTTSGDAEISAGAR